MAVRTLYRPVGLLELELILEADARAFPPRLPEQPIFYPVLDRGYAEQIARDWNPPDPRSGFAGFVTEFDLESAFLERFETKVVGGAQHQELWVPAEELAELNARLLTRIRTTRAFYGAQYRGPRPRSPELPAQPREQLGELRALTMSGADFERVIDANWRVVLANFGLWSATKAEEQGLTPQAAQA